MENQIENAVAALRAGGVIAYPTEYCFGLGCDPRNADALARLLSIKQRQKEQGVILVASTLEQVTSYANLHDLEHLEKITNSWPGPSTWLIPAKESVSSWVKGRHTSVAMRISAHPICLSLCTEFTHPIVSTSANRHGQKALLSAAAVKREFAEELDFIIDAPVGNATSASTIRDAVTGEQLR